MKKIPVGATIAHAYRFAFGNFLLLLRRMWLALALQLALSVVIAGRAAALMTAMQAKDPSATSLLGPVLLLYPLVLILFFMQFLTVTESALDLEQRSSWFIFPLGKKLWRLIGGFILAALAIIALTIAYVLACMILLYALRFALHGAVSPAVVLLTALLFLVCYGGWIFLAIRFFFLLAPVNVAEQRLGVGRAWLLSRGNFWRAFLIVLAILLPVVVIEYAALFAAVGFPPMPPRGDIQAIQAARLGWNIAAMSAITTYWYIAVPLLAVIMVLYFGAGCGAQAFAYRALTEDEGLAPIAGD